MRTRLSGALITALVVTLVSVAPSEAAVPLTKSRPYKNLCEHQGGTFGVAIDFRSLYCDKEGGLFTAFTQAQLDRQRQVCQRHYGGFFGVQGFIRPDGVTGTGTFCHVE